ncbi:MAG TPA: T9SS type A sorting domain-containing protein, partial [Bacteroidia bacterium]|nr:T9SS type A sorting domain-containing protein [Bacteroidia bacterium]
SINSDKSILLSGESYSTSCFDKSENNMGPEQLWMIQVDTAGNKLMDKTFFSFGHDEEGMALESSPGNYFGCISSVVGIGGYKSIPNYGLNDVWVCALKPAVGVEENIMNEVNVYPNPVSSGQIHIQSKFKTSDIKLYDLRGVELIDEKSSDLENFSMDISSLSDGVYFLRIQSATNVLTQRIIVKHP